MIRLTGQQGHSLTMHSLAVTDSRATAAAAVNIESCACYWTPRVTMAAVVGAAASRQTAAYYLEVNGGYMDPCSMSLKSSCRKYTNMVITVWAFRSGFLVRTRAFLVLAFLGFLVLEMTSSESFQMTHIEAKSIYVCLKCDQKWNSISASTICHMYKMNKSV